MKTKNLVITALITILSISPASAVTKVIKVLPVKPILITTLSGSSGDQISAVSTTATEIALVGTVESSTASQVTTSAYLGGSDGFIASIDPTGNHLWDLHLGSIGDEIATAVVRDKVGSFWVFGASAIPATPPIPTAPDSTTVNIDNVVIDPLTNSNNSLTQLMAWKVSLTGQLVATYSYDAGGVVNPNSVTFDGTTFLVSGLIEDQRFTVRVSQTGEFTKFTRVTSKAVIAPAITTIKAGTGSMKSFISKGAIKGVTSWKPKSAIPVLIEYNKAGAITRASYFQGKVISVLWQSGIGPIVITERSDGYGINILGLAK